MDDPTPRTQTPTPTRATLTLPAQVAAALIRSASRNFRRPREEAVALIAERLRETGDLPTDRPKR